MECDVDPFATVGAGDDDERSSGRGPGRGRVTGRSARVCRRTNERQGAVPGVSLRKEVEEFIYDENCRALPVLQGVLRETKGQERLNCPKTERLIRRKADNPNTKGGKKRLRN